MQNSDMVHTERSVLSAIFFNQDNLEKVVFHLKEEDFDHLPHKMIYTIMLRLREERLTISEHLVIERLSDEKFFSEQDLIEVIAVPPSDNIEACFMKIKKR